VHSGRAFFTSLVARQEASATAAARDMITASDGEDEAYKGVLD